MYIYVLQRYEETMPECENCGEWVSQRFKRVMSIDGDVVKCLDCAPARTDAVDPKGQGPQAHELSRGLR